MRKLLIVLTVTIGVGMFVIFGVWTIVFAEEVNDIVDEAPNELPELYIKAINPGYTLDGKSNVGEMIEIARKDSDEPFSLAGTTVSYTNSSGNNSKIFEFPENSWMIGESILLRLASSPESELAAGNYKKTLAFTAGLSLEINGEVVDEVCWTGKEGCLREFKSSNPTTLLRDVETGEFEHVSLYEPVYDVNSYYVEQSQEEEGYGALPGQCKGLEFSEILSYYETTKSEQFIELLNRGSEQILLDGCQIRYKNKNYIMNGVVGPEEYHVYYPEKFSLTKNPTNSNTLELVDTNGAVLDSLTYLNGQRKGTAYAFIGYDNSGQEIWRTTYAPTPGAPNNYQEYRTCETGKVINKATGNCVKVAEVKTKICKEGEYLNILTGRCRKIETTKEKTCKEGYYLNPETNRCRKIRENDGAEYNMEPKKYEESSTFVAWYAVIGVALVGVGYLVYEFRHDLWRAMCAFGGKIRGLLSRRKQ